MRRVQPWCRSSCTLIPVWCSGNCRNCVRASCTSWCGDTRGLCAQQWFGLGDECTRLSFERRGAVLWTDPPASVGTSVANCCYLRAGCCRTVCMGWCKTSGKVHTRLRFKLCGRSAPPCAQCCARMRIRCTRLSIPVATRMCTRCANVQTTACAWLQRKSWHCGDARVMDVLLGLMHCWRCSGEPYIPVCPSVGGSSANCQREISHNKTSGESGGALLRGGRYSSKWL